MFLRTALAALACSAVAQAVAPSLTVYRELGHQGENVTFDTSTPDLGGWADVARSVCVNGFWVLFSVPEYGVDSYRLYVMGAPNCADLDQYNLDKTLKSIRRVGVPDDIEGKSLSLFADDFFSGEVTYLADDTPSIPNGGNFASAVISGSEPWSIYSEENYGGYTMCLSVHTEFYPVYGWFADTTEMGAVGGAVMSAHKGCPLQPAPAEVQPEPATTGSKSRD